MAVDHWTAVQGLLARLVHAAAPPVHSLEHPMYASVLEHAKARGQRVHPIPDGPSRLLTAALADPAPLPVLPRLAGVPAPDVPSLDDLDDAAKASVIRETRPRGTKEAAMTPRTLADLRGRTLTTVPCRRDKAGVAVLRVHDAASVLGVALYGLTTFVDLAVARAAFTPVEGGVRATLQHVLTTLLLAGVPMLVATGMGTHDRVTKRYHGMYAMVAAGSPLLLVDRDDNVVALGRPVGELTYVPPGATGVVPAQLRAPSEAMTCLELWVELLAVAPHDEFACSAWFDTSPAGDPDFRWGVNALERPGYRSLKRQPASTYVPRNCPIVTFFRGMTLEYLAYGLGDYRAKLAAWTGVPLAPPRAADADSPRTRRAGRMKAGDKAARVRAMVDDPGMYVQWRRAVLLSKVLARGIPAGHAVIELTGVLPPLLLPPASMVAFEVRPPRPVDVDALLACEAYADTNATLVLSTVLSTVARFEA